MPDEPSKRKGVAEKGRKRTRKGSSQTDDEDASDQHHKQRCKRCLETTNSRLSGIKEKLNTLLAILPEMEFYKQRTTRLEEENIALQTSLEDLQAEIEDLRTIVSNVNLKQEVANTACERFEREFKESHRRHVKLECHSRRGNMKFFGIKEHDNETNSDTELVLRKFIHTKLKITPVDEENIHFDRVHRITSRRSQANLRSPKSRPIIVRLTNFQDEPFIKSFIKNLPRGTGFGISDDFPKEVDEVRKSLYPILKTARREKKAAYFNVEKLIIEGALYRGEETSQFSFYGRLMDN